MATRYVWNEYESAANLPAPRQVNDYLWVKNTNYAKAGKDYTIRKFVGATVKYFMYELIDSVALGWTGTSATNALTYPYLVQSRDAETREIMLQNRESVSGARYHWRQKPNGRLGCQKVTTNSNGGNNEEWVNFNLYEGFLYTKGVLLGKRAAGQRESYPSGPSSDGLTYYEYVGADTIDPKSLTYSAQELQGGDPVTITAAPVSPTYGGTVYYQYSYSTNGGASWVNIGSKTTATSQTLTIPNGVSQFQARVQASDDLGFTSSDYVMGQAMEVISMQAYVGIGGKARRIEKIYIGVNGKAREVVAGYVGVNGKARKFL